MSDLLYNSPLGKQTQKTNVYDPKLLYPVSREAMRATLNLQTHRLPFQGYDVLNAYELSWLDPEGKPNVAIGQFTLPADSPRLIESKSLKLYLHSFNDTHFETRSELQHTLELDLSQAAQAKVTVNLYPVDSPHLMPATVSKGICLDDLKITGSDGQPAPQRLMVKPKPAQEILYSHLFRSNCPVTGQPDWATVIIAYQGKQIDRRGLLRYLVSFRHHMSFHEHCIEHIYRDILQQCQPITLFVQGCFTRRGGIDINPVRYSKGAHGKAFARFVRQ